MYPESMREDAEIWKATREIVLRMSEEPAPRPESLEAPLESIKFGTELTLVAELVPIAVNLIIVAQLIVGYIRDKKKDKVLLDILDTLKKDVELRGKVLDAIRPIAVKFGVEEEQVKIIFERIIA